MLAMTYNYETVLRAAAGQRGEKHWSRILDGDRKQGSGKLPLPQDWEENKHWQLGSQFRVQKCPLGLSSPSSRLPTPHPPFLMISQDFDLEGSPAGSVNAIVLCVSRQKNKFSLVLDRFAGGVGCLLSTPLLQVRAFGVWGWLRDTFTVYLLLRKIYAKLQTSEMYFYCTKYLWHEDQYNKNFIWMAKM